MYAVIETGGKQYRVRAGDIIEIEKIPGEVGAPIKFEQVLLLSQPGEENPKVWIGKPLVAQASVTGKVVAQGRGEKLHVFKMTRRTQYRRLLGHRQELSQVLVTAVDSGAGARETLSDADAEAKLAKFFTQLTPKGPARRNKSLGSREWLRRNSADKHAKKAAPAGEGHEKHKATAPKKAAAKPHAPKAHKTEKPAAKAKAKK